jgi:predicted phosphodiesterase
MRIAVSADIHGNILALEAVLADLSTRAVDRIVNLGDCLSGPLWPREAMERLEELDAVTVRGNHDREAAETPPAEMAPSDSFAYANTSPAQRAWLGALPQTATVAPGVLACHGTPASDLKYLVEAVSGGRMVRSRPEKIADRLAGLDARIVLCGHSHRADLVRLPDGRLMLNPGSVGCPAYRVTEEPQHVSEAGSPHARYAILDVGADGSDACDFRALPYDFEAAARRAEENGRPEWAHALRTGLMPT